MRNTYRVKSYRTFAPKPPNAQLMNAIRNSRFIQKSDTPNVAYVVKNTFNDFNICAELKTNISRKQYASPTPIQDQSIPSIIEGKDVIGIANTGTGKTQAN